MFGFGGLTMYDKAKQIYECAQMQARKLCDSSGPVARIPESCFFLSKHDAEACTLVSLVHAFRGCKCIPLAYDPNGGPHIKLMNDIMLQVVKLAYQDYGGREIDNAWNSCAMATRTDQEQMSAQQMFGRLTPESWSFVHLTYTINWLFFAINGFENCYLQNEMSEMATSLISEYKVFIDNLSHKIDFC